MTPAPIRLLLIEPPPPAGRTFADDLRDAGMTVHSAPTADQGLQQTYFESFDIVVAAFQLPDRTGPDLCRTLKGEGSRISCPVLLLSATGVPADVLLGLDAGADGVLAENQPAERNIAKIRRAVQRGPAQNRGAVIRQTVSLNGQTMQLAIRQDQLVETLVSSIDDLNMQAGSGGPAPAQLEEQRAERERLEIALRESDAIYQSLVQNVPVSLFRKDLDGRFTFGNRPFCRSLGCDPADLEGKTDFDFFPAELATKYRANDEEVIRTGAVFEDVEQHTTPDGHDLFVHVLKAPVIGADESISGIQCVFWDVTDRVKAERELISSEARNQAIFDGSLDCMIISDANGRILEFNRAAERTFGYRRQEVLGQEMDELLFSPMHRARSRENLDRYSTTREEGSLLGKRLEVPLVRKNGEEFIAEIAIQPIPLGSDVQFATVLHDISNRKKAERKLEEATAAAEAANRAKSDFLANMSHEIRTPMNAVIGMTELVLDTELSQEQRQHLKIVQGSAESLLDLINDILDFSKIEAGKLDLDPMPFTLRDRIGDTMKSLAIRAHEKELELACRIHPNVPEAVVGDSGRLRQVIVNLVGNAIKFTDRGEVVLNVETLHDGTLSADSELPERVRLRFTVRDTGIGIAPKKQAAIFNAFEQADTSTTRRFGGTGLGLAISSELVKLMGGEITLDSQSGKGSTFTFVVEFPVSDRSEASLEESVPVTVRGLPVLAVDDNATNRQILDEMLRNWGMCPQIAEGAAEAIKMLVEKAENGEAIPIVITDSNMPDVDGFELVQQINRHDALQDTAILMLTSADRPGDVERCRELGVQRYMTKPVKQSELLEAIELAAGLPVPVVEGDDAEPRPEGSDSLDVLLVEDSHTNQILARMLLEKKHHRVTTANDGQEALKLFAEHAYDLILMDVQMPVMDGFAATALIREREASGTHHTPIIAMTAHAMKGDRERCLQAGMDAYISKPIRTEELYSTIDRLVAAHGRPAEAVQPASPSTADQAGVETRTAEGGESDVTGERLIDWRAALESVSNHETILISVIEAVLEEVPQLLHQLRQAIADRDFPVMQRAAHTLKGTMRTFAVTQLINRAEQLEIMGQNHQTDGADQILPELEQLVEAAVAELQAYRPQSATVGEQAAMPADEIDSSESIFDD